MIGEGIILRHERHYGDRVLRCFLERPPTVDAMFRQAVARGAQREALSCGARRMTYGELDRAVEGTASGLARLGLVKGDRLAILLGNEIEFVVAMLAASRIGAVSVPMNIRQRRPETLFMLNQCAAKALVYDAALIEHLPDRGELPSLCHEIVVGPSAGRDALPFEELASALAAPAVAIAEEDLFCLLYTSGTTGRPKGAMLTHLGVVHSTLHYQGALGLGEHDTAVLAVPASHVTGLIAILLAMIRVGGRTAILPVFRAADFLTLAARERMTYTLVVPAIYNLCLINPDFARHDLSAWRIGGFGGAPMSGATIARLSEALPGLSLYNVYGSTETTSPVTVLPAADIAHCPDSVGRVLPCCDLIVVDEDGREVPCGETGELWIAGANVVPGYWDNPDATRTSFVGGYWTSGDIGSIDDGGYVRIFDRKKDVVNRAGFKVYSIEVENELAKHPAVLECAVTGREDAVLGERVEAFVVCRPGLDASVEELREFCARSLSDYKVPDIVTRLSTPLPRNANGKVLKGELRRLHAGTALERSP
jgi:long-chain acyl-CoA synthetase